MSSLLTSNFHLEYLHVERYRRTEEVCKMTWMPFPTEVIREVHRRREVELRRAAERTRLVSPLRRAPRRPRVTDV
jgi:hypothetical protein